MVSCQSFDFIFTYNQTRKQSSTKLGAFFSSVHIWHLKLCSCRFHSYIFQFHYIVCITFLKQISMKSILLTNYRHSFHLILNLVSSGQTNSAKFCPNLTTIFVNGYKHRKNIPFEWWHKKPTFQDNSIFPFESIKKKKKTQQQPPPPPPQRDLICSAIVCQLEKVTFQSLKCYDNL